MAQGFRETPVSCKNLPRTADSSGLTVRFVLLNESRSRTQGRTLGARSKRADPKNYLLRLFVLELVGEELPDQFGGLLLAKISGLFGQQIVFLRAGQG